MTGTHDTTLADIKATYSTIQNDLRLNAGTPDARSEARDRLEELEEPLSYLIGERGFEEFVAERLEAYRRETDKTLCSCWRSTCPLKRGKVPPKLRQHGSSFSGERRPPSELLVEYQQRHDGGEALDLIRREWAQMAVHTDLELADIRTLLKRPPDERKQVAQNVGVELGDDGQPVDGTNTESTVGTDTAAPEAE